MNADYEELLRRFVELRFRYRELIVAFDRLSVNYDSLNVGQIANVAITASTLAAVIAASILLARRLRSQASANKSAAAS